MKTERKNYVDKKVLYSEISDYKNTGVISENLHLLIYDMAKRVASKYRFYNYTWKDDMICEAYLRCIKYMGSYDLTKSNPFGYFTTIIHHTFFAFRNKEMSYQYKKWDELSKLISNLEHEHNITLSLPEDIKLRLYSNTASPYEEPTEESEEVVDEYSVDVLEEEDFNDDLHDSNS